MRAKNEETKFRIYEYINLYIKAHRVSPSIKDIAKEAKDSDLYYIDGRYYSPYIAQYLSPVSIDTMNNLASIPGIKSVHSIIDKSNKYSI